LNEIIYRAFSSAGIPAATKEPVGLTGLDGLRPDGRTSVPWCVEKDLTSDVTDVSTLTDSYYRIISVISQSYPFQLIAVKTSGIINSSAVDFLNVLQFSLFLQLIRESAGAIF